MVMLLVLALSLGIELSSLETSTQRIEARGDVTTVPATELKMTEIAETITVSCGLGAQCLEEGPKTRFDLPRCSEYELDLAIVNAIGRGDRSAVPLALERLQNATTYIQELSLADELLGTSADQTAWNTLYAHAQIAVQFPSSRDGKPSPEFLQWAEEHALHPELYWSVALTALANINDDPRSRTLLHQALNSDEVTVMSIAIAGFAAQKDASALTAIERALERYRDSATLIWQLAEYETEEADALAFRYLVDDSERERYRRLRDETNP